jgi:hypothetical protein
LLLKVVSSYTTKRRKEKPKSVHLMGTDRPEATMVFTGFFTEILAANPLNPLKLTLVQYQNDCYSVAFL